MQQKGAKAMEDTNPSGAEATKGDEHHRGEREWWDKDGKGDEGHGEHTEGGGRISTEGDEGTKDDEGDEGNGGDENDPKNGEEHGAVLRYKEKRAVES